jgi:hypothetical protein
MRRSVTLLLVASSLGCTRTPPEPSARETATSQAPRPSASSLAAATAPNARSPMLSAPVEASERPFRFPAAERVVAVGDLHGDIGSMREALRLAGAIDDKDRWVGEKLVLVQVGDQLDRGDDEPEILRLLDALTAEAARSSRPTSPRKRAGERRHFAPDRRSRAGSPSGIRLPSSATRCLPTRACCPNT